MARLGGPNPCPLARVNDGTVFDAQLLCYRTQADTIVTADKNLHRIASIIADAAPFRTASSIRTTPGTWSTDLRNITS